MSVEQIQAIIDEHKEELKDGLYKELCDATHKMKNGENAIEKPYRVVAWTASPVINCCHVQFINRPTKHIIMLTDTQATDIKEEIALVGACPRHFGKLSETRGPNDLLRMTIDGLCCLTEDGEGDDPSFPFSMNYLITKIDMV